MRPGPLPHAVDAVDVAGLALAVLAADWAVVSAERASGDAGVVIRAVGLAVGAHAGARALGAARTWLPAVAVAAAAVVAWLRPFGTAYASGVPFGPVRYANASGLLFVVVAAAAVALARSARTIAGRRAAAGVAAVAAVAVVAAGAAAPVALLLPVVGAVLVRAPGAVRRLQVACMVSALVAVAMTSVVGAGVATGLAGEVATDVRVALWQDAVDLAADHPMSGVGPGRYQEASALASGNVDLVASHNDYLQAAAELGVPGAALAVLGAGWGFLRLWRWPPTVANAAATAGYTAAVVHAAVDYSLHAPLVLACVAVVVAVARPTDGAVAVTQRRGSLRSPLGRGATTCAG